MSYFDRRCAWLTDGLRRDRRCAWLTDGLRRDNRHTETMTCQRSQEPSTGCMQSCQRCRRLQREMRRQRMPCWTQRWHGQTQPLHGPQGTLADAHILASLHGSQSGSFWWVCHDCHQKHLDTRAVGVVQEGCGQASAAAAALRSRGLAVESANRVGPCMGIAPLCSRPQLRSVVPW